MNIIDTLNDLSKAIEEMANSLKSKKEDEKKIRASFFSSPNKITEELKINVKNIKKDTEEILKNQKTLIKISKEKQSNTSLFETSNDKKTKVKDGVNTVLLIASGVLAIGIAFKMIGQVDFLSVIALSVALPLVAMSFEKISEMKGMKPPEMRNMFFTIVTMATSLTVTSWIMQLITPISIWQGVTAILIAGTFAIISHSIESITKGIKNVSAFDIIKMPLVLFSVGLSIALASQVMHQIHPITIAQGLTSILIAGTFAIISHSIEDITKNIKNVSPKQIILMPFVLTALALSITLSSQIMRGIHVITIGQALSGIAVAATLLIMSYALRPLSEAVKNTDLKTAAKMVLILPLLSLAIAMSSWALKLVVPLNNLFGVVLTSIAIGIISVITGIAMWALNSMGMNPVNALLGGISMVIIAGTIAASAKLLSLSEGNYGEGKYPSIMWAAGVGLSIVAFGLSAIILGAEMSTGIGAVALGLGLVGILGISATVIATAAILNAGKYGNYPSFDWASGVALSLGTFGIGMISLGAFLVASFGTGLIVLAAGSTAIMVIAQSIVSASDILNKGTFAGGPTKEWAEGISLSLGAFAPIFKTLFDRGILGLFSKGPSIEDFNKAIVSVSSGIVTAGKYFMDAPDVWKNAPTAEWAAGAGGAISAFTPVFAALSKSSGIFGSGPKPEDMNDAMLSIANTIVTVGKVFQKAKDEWTDAPSSEWSTGVSNSISAFAPVFDYLSKNNGWFSTPSSDLKNAILGIAHAIVETATILNDGKFITVIPDGYIKSMSENIKTYVDLVEYLQKKNVDAFSFIDTMSITYGLTKLSQGYDKLANSVKSLTNSLNGLDVEKLQALNRFTGGIIMMSLMDPEQFEKMMDALEKKSDIFRKIAQELNGEETQDFGFGTVNSVKTNSNDKNTTEILATLNRIDSKMGIVVNNCKSFVNYIDELRANTNIKPKKHL